MRSTLSRTCLLLLALTLASSPLLAAPAQPGFFATLWEKLSSIMDPNGCPASTTASDLGSGMDPDGRK